MPTQDLTAAVNQHLTGFDRLIGLEITDATATRVCAELTIASCHTQIHGVVHGGVYTSIVETLGSIGAALSARTFGRTIVGLDNHTSFLKATREGLLTAVSEPITQGKRTQLWQTCIYDANQQLVAKGQLRLLCIEEGSMPNIGPMQTGSPFKLGDMSR